MDLPYFFRLPDVPLVPELSSWSPLVADTTLYLGSCPTLVLSLCPSPLPSNLWSWLTLTNHILWSSFSPWNLPPRTLYSIYMSHWAVDSNWWISHDLDIIQNTIVATSIPSVFWFLFVFSKASQVCWHPKSSVFQLRLFIPKSNIYYDVFLWIQFSFRGHLCWFL